MVLTLDHTKPYAKSGHKEGAKPHVPDRRCTNQLVITFGSGGKPLANLTDSMIHQRFLKYKPGNIMMNQPTGALCWFRGAGGGRFGKNKPIPDGSLGATPLFPRA